MSWSTLPGSCFWGLRWGRIVRSQRRVAMVFLRAMRFLGIIAVEREACRSLSLVSVWPRYDNSIIPTSTISLDTRQCPFRHICCSNRPETWISQHWLDLKPSARLWALRLAFQSRKPCKVICWFSCPEPDTQDLIHSQDADLMWFVLKYGSFSPHFRDQAAECRTSTGAST